MKPSDKDIEKADAIVKDWYEGWLKCPTWTEAFQKYGVQEISKALAAERASLPKVVTRLFNMVASEEAKAQLKAWKEGK